MIVRMLLQKILGLILILFTLLGCTKIEADNPRQVINLALDAKYQNSTFASSTIIDNTVTTSIIYVCENSTVKRIYKNDPGSFSKFEFNESLLNSRSRVYAIFNYHLVQGAESIAVGGSQASVEALNAAHLDTPQALIMAAVADISKVVNQQINVNMVRNIARFDIGIKGSGVAIHEISVSGLAQKGSVFSDIILANNSYTTNFEAIYPTPLTSDIEGVFYAYELPADKQALINAKVSYDGVLTNLRIPITQIRRNHLYKIVFSSIGSIVTAAIDVSGMDEGDSDDAVTNHIPIKIDPANSTLPANTELNEDNMRLILPYAGATATIALTGDFDKQYTIDGAIDGLVVTPVAGTAYQNNRLTITIPANRRMGGNNPVALISVGAKGETDPTKFDRIAIVSTNFAPFEVVTMAGIDWIPINNISANPGDYPVLQAGQTMRELYAKNWMKYCAQGRMWGPRPGHSKYGQIRLDPWQYLPWLYDGTFDYNNLSKSNGDIIGGGKTIKWDDPNTTLCSDGWRVAERDEFLKIWPPIDHDFAVNASVSYSTSAGNFTATIEDSGWFNHPYGGGTAKNLVITDQDGASVLFPIGGWRSQNSIHSGGYGGTGVDVAKTVFYWCRTRSVNSNYAKVVGLENLRSWEGEKPADYFLSVRCVRDVK